MFKGCLHVHQKCKHVMQMKFILLNFQSCVLLKAFFVCQHFVGG